MKKTGLILFLLMLCSMLSLLYELTPFSVLFLALLFAYVCRAAAQLFPEGEEEPEAPIDRAPLASPGPWAAHTEYLRPARTSYSPIGGGWYAAMHRARGPGANKVLRAL